MIDPASPSRRSPKLLFEGFNPDRRYNRGDIIRDGPFLMASLENNNFDRAAPQSAGSPTYALDSASFATQVDAGYVLTGTEFTIGQGGVIRAVRWDIPTINSNYLYQLVFGEVVDGVFQALINSTLPPTFSTPGWYEQAVGYLASAGSVWRIGLIAENQLGAVVGINGQWVYGGQSQSGQPGAGRWNVNNQYTTLRIHQIDNDSGDQSQELSEIAIGDTVTVIEGTSRWDFRINQAGTLSGGVWTFTNVERFQALGLIDIDQVCDMASYHEGVADTDYSVDTDYWLTNQPEWGEGTGIINTDGSSGGFAGVVYSDNGFGADLEVEPATVSDKWYPLAITETFSAGASALMTADDVATVKADSMPVFYSSLATSNGSYQEIARYPVNSSYHGRVITRGKCVATGDIYKAEHAFIVKGNGTLVLESYEIYELSTVNRLNLRLDTGNDVLIIEVRGVDGDVYDWNTITSFTEFT